MQAQFVRLGLSALAAVVLAGGAGAAVAPAFATPAIARAPAAHHVRVQPSGAGAGRSVRRSPARPRAATRISPATVTTAWVSNSVPVGANTGCSSPGYTTISAALADLAAGGTVNVCAGTYTEQLAITQSATLIAKGAVTVLLPASPSSSLTSCDADGGGQPNQDVVDICGPAAVTITGFTIQGSWPSNVCYNSLYGVAVLGGASLTMSRSTVTGIGGDPLTDGCQGGVGIQVGLATSATTADPGTATLSNVVVNRYQKNGITVDGTGSSAKITGATVTGAGPTDAIAQNGIQISDGATATISGGTVTGDECNDAAGGCGPDGFSDVQSAGVLLFDAGVTTVSGTTVTASDIGVYTIEDYPWAYYTPPSSVVLQQFFSLGLANRYENAYFDEGKAKMTTSSLSGGEAGVEMAQWHGQATSAVATVTGTTVTGATSDAVLVASDQVSGDKAVKLTATSDGFDTSNAGGVVNQSTSALNVKGDWWGDPSGPSVWSFGAGSSVSSDVNFFPWATNSMFTAQESCTPGGTVHTTGNDVVLCANAGTSNAYLANDGTGNVLLIGNSGNDQLVGSSAGGETWIIGGTKGSNVINGNASNGGTGFIQERGDTHDTLVDVGGYTIAAS